jgi:hypothetical protein
MDHILEIIAIVISLLTAAISTTWIVAMKTGLKREELTKIVDDVTARIEKLIDKIDQLTANSVSRQEFQKELITLREKITKHIGNVDIHVGHKE